MIASKKWWFFRFRGITVEDEPFNLNSLQFGDCELISTGALQNFINDTEKSDLHRRTLNQLITNSELPIANSYLVVCRMVPESQNLKVAEDKAFYKARIFAALFSLCTLVSGNLPISCGLTREANDNLYDSILFENPNWSATFEQKGRVSFRTAFQYSRTGLGEIFQHSDIAPLANIVTGRNITNLTQRMRLKLMSAMVRLASGIWSNEADSLLLGSFTSMEMLLGDGGHDRLVARIATLLGEEISNKYRLEEVTHARHQYVHRGNSVDIEMGLTAVALAFNVLITYCKLASNLNKNACNPTLINLLLDLRGQNPPVSVPTLSLLYSPANTNFSSFRPSLAFLFHEPAVLQQSEPQADS